ncbi:MAG: DUF362 domain-containing protein [Candidatus Cloacimonetes bacterium]|nr:DUF362 domain-containing protein [Candidatus Cloacimonadota bacterium]
MTVHIQTDARYDVSQIREFLETTDFIESIKDFKRILVKPNLLGPHSPDKAVTTHPDVIRAVVSMITDRGKQVIIGDSPGGLVPAAKVYETTGVKAVAEEFRTKLVVFEKEGFRVIQYNNSDLHIANPYFDCDSVVNICKYKTHGMMQFTGAVKNLYGFIPGLKKALHHRDRPDTKSFSLLLADLYMALKPKLAYHIMDGIVGMDGEGPSAGNPYPFGILFASSSAPELDAVASRMMGFRSGDIAHINTVLERDGILPSRIDIRGCADDYVFSSANIRTVRIKSLLFEKTPPWAWFIFKKLFDFYPDFNSKCVKCGICVKSCPVNAMTMPTDGNHPVIDYSKCINCLCCHELCPYQAVYIKKTWLAKRLIP